MEQKRVLCPFQFLTIVNNVAIEFCIFILFNYDIYDVMMKLTWIYCHCSEEFATFI